MSRGGKRWERQVREHFDFLFAHAFRFDHVDSDSWWATTAVYLSPTLGVEVTDSVEFDRVEVTLLRLVAGELPEVEVWVTESPMNRVLFDNVLEARAPELLETLPTGRSKGAIEEQLGRWAELLRSVAPDFLQGDDSAILDGERVVRQRVRENPQELTVWLPGDASPAHEAEAREEAERTAPPGVQLVMRRYAR